MTSDKNDDDKRNANFLKEWEIARNVLKDFDAHLHDLRKTGFSFLTALLAAEALIFPVRLAESGTKILPDETKFAVLLVDLILIVALQLIDRNYQIFQRAAATRARVLERVLNLELTEVISQRYERANVQWYVTAVYLFFVAGVSILGVFALYPNYFYITILLIFAVVAIIAEYLVFKYKVRVRYPYGMMDWTIDRLQCNEGDEIGITLTNLEEKKIKFTKGDTMWKIVKEGDEKVPLHTETLDRSIVIPADDSYTWLWTTKGVGIHRVHRLTRDKDEKFKPLKRKLRIKGNRKDNKIDKSER